MRKKYVFIVAVAFIGAVFGVALTTKFHWESPAKATEAPRYYQEGEKPAELVPSAPVQPTGLFSSPLPGFADLAKKVGPSVVNINTTKNVKRRAPGGNRRSFGGGGPQDPFDDFFNNFFDGRGGGGMQEAPQKSLGSGFIINSEGYILTNNHVIAGADEVQVQLSSNKKYDAKVIGSDEKTDLAVIKITAKDIPAAILGDSDKLQVGDWVMAVGNPFGLDHTVTAGIVSAKGRVIGAGPYDDFIQTDASINPGNSGGPLFNLQGEVVGVNAAIVASGQGIGFAIPINMAKQLVPQLISNGKVKRAWLGVGIQDMTPELAKSFGLADENGALVSNIVPGGPADKGGLKSGDVIRSLNGVEIKASHELPAMVAKQPIGTDVALKVLRDGKEITLNVKLGDMADGEKVSEENTKTDSGDLGIVCRELTPEEVAELNLPKENHGVVIVNVDPSSAAAQVGVQRGDILLTLNNAKLNSTADFSAAAKKINVGDIVRLFIKRDNSTVYLAFKK